MLPWDLEDWLTDKGDKVVNKASAADSLDALDVRERLTYELWLLDTEQRNGGISQYFANRGFQHWDMLSRLAASTLPSFSMFASRVDAVVGRSEDPYQAVMDSNEDLDAWYYSQSTLLVTELRATVRPTS